MSGEENAAVDGTGRSSSKPRLKIAEIGLLLWMIGISVLWWLMYGPGMTFITERLGILPGLSALRTALLQFFTFTSWGVR